jgi:hypothetical protein
VPYRQSFTSIVAHRSRPSPLVTRGHHAPRRHRAPHHHHVLDAARVHGPTSWTSTPEPALGRNSCAWMSYRSRLHRSRLHTTGVSSRTFPPLAIVAVGACHHGAATRVSGLLAAAPPQRHARDNATPPWCCTAHRGTCGAAPRNHDFVATLAADPQQARATVFCWKFPPPHLASSPPCSEHGPICH